MALIKQVPTSKATPVDGMTIEELKMWLKRFDVDHDGRISEHELRRAMRVAGGHPSHWTTRRAVRRADRNGDGLVGEDEISNLVAFVRKELGVKIVK